VLDIPILETTRLRLRPWKPGCDAAAVFEYASCEETTRYMLFQRHKNIIDAEVFLTGCITSPEHAYAVTLLGSDHPIGGCGLRPEPPYNSGEIGYILHKDYWGRGYATELAQRLIRYGFETLKLHRVFARCDDRNKRSCRVLEKAGMQYEGTLRDCIKVRDEYRTLQYFGILRSEWEKP
jgi:ribosomal-protein-alanine N-acetyltransferase